MYILLEEDEMGWRLCGHVGLMLWPHRKLSKNKVSKQIVSTSGEPQTQLPLKIQDSERTEYVAPVSYTEYYVDVCLLLSNQYPYDLH